MAALRDDVATSRRPLPNAAELFASPPHDWSDALGRLRLAAATGQPTIVVLDEIPWAMEKDPTLESRLQAAWDRQLEGLPLLIILIGSDLAMMQRLTQHDRPLYGRAAELQIRPFNPAECRLALGSGASARDAFDAHLVTGGYPRLVDELRRAGGAPAFVTAGLRDENSSLLLVGQRVLDAELPTDAQARRVLHAIGSDPVGHSTFSNAAAALGPAGTGTSQTAVTRGVEHLQRKDVLEVSLPFGAKPTSKTTRYRVLDPYLSLWMRFVEPHAADIARGRADIAIAAFQRNWTGWRGIAVEPLVREAVLRLGATHPLLDGVDDVGGWWNRENNPEVDVVAGRLPDDITWLGTVKWRDRKPVTLSDVHALQTARSAVPNAAAAQLLTVSLAGLASDATSDLHLGPEELLAAW